MLFCCPCLARCFTLWFPSSLLQIDDDSRFDAAVQAELHCRLNTLVTALWDIVDARETEAVNHIRSLQNDGWVGNVQQSIATRFTRMMQLEVSGLYLAETG